MKTKLLVVLLLSTCSVKAQEITGVYKRYSGTLGQKQQAILDLMIADTLINGHFYYPEEGKEKIVKGSRKNESINWQPVGNAQSAPSFTGKITPDLNVIEGTWSDPAQTKSNKCSLKSFLPAGSVELRCLVKPFHYEWQKNSKGESLGYTSKFTYCYVVNMMDKAIQKKINDVLLNTDVNADGSLSQLIETAASSMEDEFSNYTDAYGEAFPDSIAAANKKFMDESPHIYNWNAEETMNVLYDEQYILCTEEFIYDFTGGAHGNYNYSYLTFDLHTGELLSYDDIFNANYEAILTALIEKQLRADRKIDDKSPLSSAGLLVDHLELTDNFCINHGGIGFTYNPYEIAPYSDGAIRIFLTWQQLKSLIRPEGPLGWAAK